MPTALPTLAQHIRRLSRRDAARLLILVARVRLLNLWMHAEVRRGSGFADDRLLRLMGRWLALHEAIGALLPATPEPEHVAEVRATLQPLSGPSEACSRIASSMPRDDLGRER